MATIKDVAKQAGVSTTTVSHVINKTRFVAKETEQAVWQAIKQLRYSPSALARSLKINHTQTIGLLASSTEAPYFAELIEALEFRCYQQGYTLILCNTHNDLQKQQSYLSMLAQKRVDGLVVMCAEYPPALLAHLENYQAIPMVVLDWQQTKQSFTDTIIDNAFRGGYLAGQYLIERGHRDIAVITGSLQRHTGSSRLDGFRCALADHHLPLKAQWLLEGNFEPSSGYQAMEKLLMDKIHPTAVFCGGDMMAMGAISAAHYHGLRVPKDISIMGYDDIKYAGYFSPALTTIHQPKEKISEMALTLLFERITDKRESVKHIELIPYLVERHSVIDGPFRDYRR